MKDQVFTLRVVTDRALWTRVFEYASQVMHLGDAVEIVVRVVRSKRSLEQNDRMWAMLTDISKQLPWMVNEQLVMMKPEDWKDVLTAALRGDIRAARGINGGLVFLGMRTSKLSRRAMSELIEFMFAFGADRGIVWSDPKHTPDPDNMPEQWSAAA